MKRLFDIVFAALGIAVLWPVLLVVALLVKLEGGGPIFFRQQRVGRGFRPFDILKFRTMIVDAPRLGPGVTIGNDKRVTRVGAFLRKAKLDELPQLFNVLRGEMSFVGPRPELPRYVQLYPEGYSQVLKVRPGITDLASIVYRDESSVLAGAADPEAHYASVVLPDKIRMAKDYVRNASVLYDVRLILVTLTVLLYPKAAVGRAIERLGRHRRALAIAAHAIVTAAAFVLAHVIVFGGAVPESERRRLLAALPMLFAARLAMFHVFGTLRSTWRATGIVDLERAAAAVGLGSLGFALAVRLMSGGAGFSATVLILDALLCLVLLAGARLVRRGQSRLGDEIPPTRRALLVASSEVADRVLRSIDTEGFTGYSVIGVLDQNPARRDTTLHGVPVLGLQSELEEILVREDPDEVVIAGATGQAARQLVRIAARYEKPVRMMSDPQRLVAGDCSDPPRPFEAEDLLFRDPIRTDPAGLEPFYSGKRVLITGAGGTIGSEISRQIAATGPAAVVLFEIHETSLYHIERELRAGFPELTVVPVIGDITDVARVAEVFEAHRPQVVFHAAAYKHVPMMEHHSAEAYRINVLGTRTMAEAAERAGTEVFVLTSTDKAVEPVSTMGLTKRIAELSVLGMNGPGKPRSIAVRFGNVLDSSGSVVPLFRQQIQDGGPITVTHAEVTRLFMTVPEAVQLILHAGTLGEGGEVFVLDMGKPVRILDLAKTMARLHGLAPGRDIDIVFTGLRPGERLFETMFNGHEKIWKTPHPKILMAVNGSAGPEGQQELRRLLATLEQRIAGGGARLASTPTPDPAPSAPSSRS